jgi:hypothetical protein
MIAPSFFLSAKHTYRSGNNVNGTGRTLSFRTSDDRTEVPVTRTTIDGNNFDVNTDLWLGEFGQPLPAGFITYPIFITEDPNDLAGREIFIFGWSKAWPQFRSDPTDSSTIDESLQQRVGKNRIESVNLTENDLNTFTFTMDASIADVTGPDGIGDGIIDQLDADVLNVNLDINDPVFPFGYLEGNLEWGVFDGAAPPATLNVVDTADVVDFTVEIIMTGGAVDFGNSGLQVLEPGTTGGFGWDEAVTRGGDSGAPSFTCVETTNDLGEPVKRMALIGTHFRVGLDNIAGVPLADISQWIHDRSATEQPCFVSHSKKVILGEQSYEIPVFLADNLGPRRVFGDVTGDFKLNKDDILAMEQEVRSHQDAEAANASYPYNWGFDLNSDNQINIEDFVVLMEKGFKTSRADCATYTPGTPGMSSVVNDGPDGIVNVFGEGFRYASNSGLSDQRFFDDDLNLDGEITVLGDGFILVQQLGIRGLLRLNLDFNADGQLNADDIDLLGRQMVLEISAIDNGDPFDHVELYDLTTSEDDGGVIIKSIDQAGVADGKLDRADLLYYLEDVLGTTFGDLNLDGVTDEFIDGFAQDISLGNTEDQGTFGWADGDLDFDGDVDHDDAALLDQIFVD